MFVCKFSNVVFAMYSRRNNGTVLLTTVKNSKDFLGKINAKSRQYFQNNLLPELVTRRLDKRVEINQKMYCLIQKPSFGNLIGCDKMQSQNANLSGFIIPVLKSIRQLKENDVAKTARKEKI